MPRAIPNNLETRDEVTLDLRSATDRDGFDGYASVHHKGGSHRPLHRK